MAKISKKILGSLLSLPIMAHPLHSLQLSDYQYPLPDNRIAKYPLPDRAGSRLLFYKDGAIDHRMFRDLPALLPPDSVLVFNNTRVIPARWIFSKETGASIEIFLLHPIEPHSVEQAMVVTGSTLWQCMIGNLKRWKDGQELTLEWSIEGVSCLLRARLEDREKGWVRFDWQPGTFGFRQLVEAGAKLPLPPYLHREAEESDKERYQTVYSQAAGAVAAPTAGLHFTPEILHSLADKGITTDYLTLHVSAGTFQPVKTEQVADHPMHNEQVVIRKSNLTALLNDKKVVAVGTTSMRTLESMYWYGVKLLTQETDKFRVEKLDPYQLPGHVSKEDALKAIWSKMEALGVDSLEGETEIFLLPGYTFRICQGLITNFHQPGSTLMLLVAAFVGEDWKRIYEEALAHPYRFLSYGDSSLLLPKQRP
jgi:S-adenosylmethionine:tRNA ribosyltransferase-isomerase